MMRDLSLFFIQPQAYLISEIFFFFLSWWWRLRGKFWNLFDVLSLSLYFSCSVLYFKCWSLDVKAFPFFISYCLCAVGNLLFFLKKKNEIFALCYARDASWTNCGHCGPRAKRPNDKGRRDNNSNQMSKGVPFFFEYFRLGLWCNKWCWGVKHEANNNKVKLSE